MPSQCFAGRYIILMLDFGNGFNLFYTIETDRLGNFILDVSVSIFSLQKLNDSPPPSKPHQTIIKTISLDSFFPLISSS